MPQALNLSVLALSLFSFSALPQQGPATGSIEGIVVRADTEQPIANAQVTLTAVQIAEGPLPPAVVAANAAGTIPAATTGADGKFAFKDVKPDAYRLAATANGFARQEYGQRALNSSGRLLFVVAEQSINDANIRMTPAGTVSGRILDQNGQPATGVPVELLRAVNTLQGKTYQRAGATPVDDRGAYRIFGVPPGRYYLMAGTPLTGINLFLGMRGNPAGGSRYSLMYYPNALELDQAETIEVKAGNESSFDMRLDRLTQTFHVRGRVINPTGAPFPQNTIAGIGFRTFSSAGSANSPGSFDPATGTFDIPNVPPGNLFVVISQTLEPGARGGLQAQSATRHAAWIPIRVTNADINGLVLTLKAPATVQGKLIVEGQPISAVPNLAQLRFTVRNVLLPLGQGMPISSAIAADGSFEVMGMREDDYRAQMSATVPGFYVKSIKLGEEDLLGRSFKFSGGNSGSFEIVLRAGTGTITGTVTDSKSQPVPGIAVALIPVEQRRFDLSRNTNTDQHGKFSITNVAPGEYKVFSWEAAPNNAYLDPGFLKQYETLGKSVSVRESSNSTVDVKVIPAQ